MGSSQHMKKRTCGVIIKCQDKYLICRSTYAKDHKGREVWGFPKGLQDYGETDEETAFRETFEEVGLSIHPTALGYLREAGNIIEYTTKKRHVIFFIVELKTIELDKLKCITMVDDKFPEVDKYLLVKKEKLNDYIFNHMKNAIVKL